MRVLIVGGSGFIGSHLTNFLVSKGQLVRIYSRSQSLYQSGQHNDGVEYICGDFADLPLLKSVLKDVEVVYHLISASLPSTSNHNPIADVSDNVVNTIKLLEYCVEASVRKVIFASSGGTIYGCPLKLPIDESDPTNPICSYGITKLAIEKYLYLFKYLHGLDYAILRISNPYGPGQNPAKNLGAITVFLNRILDDVPIQIWGDGKIVRDYIYIMDVVQALYEVQNHNDIADRLFNIGSGKGTSLNELLVIISKVTQKTFEVNYIEGRKVDIPVNILNISKAKKNLHWQPTIDLELGIEKTWQWLIKV